MQGLLCINKLLANEDIVCRMYIVVLYSKKKPHIDYVFKTVWLEEEGENRSSIQW